MKKKVYLCVYVLGGGVGLPWLFAESKSHLNVFIFWLTPYRPPFWKTSFSTWLICVPYVFCPFFMIREAISHLAFISISIRNIIPGNGCSIHQDWDTTVRKWLYPTLFQTNLIVYHVVTLFLFKSYVLLLPVLP